MTGWYTEYGWCNDWEPVEPSGSLPPDDAERARAAASGWRLVKRQKYEGDWESAE